jgi:hypothetical protein
MIVITAAKVLDASRRLETPDDSDCFLPLAIALSSAAGTGDGFDVASVMSVIESHRQELATLVAEHLANLIAKNSERNSTLYWTIIGDVSAIISRLASPPSLLSDFVWRLIAQYDLVTCHTGYYKWTKEGKALYKVCQSVFNR